MPAATPLNYLEKTVLAIGLSWGAGVIDLLGYLVLYQAFVAHMTGNTVSSVLHGIEHNWTEMFHRLLPIPAFFLGVLVAELILESARRKHRHYLTARAMAIEAAALAAFLIYSLLAFGAQPRMMVEPTRGQYVLLVTLLATAMGVQSASMRKIGALTIFTTFMTGTLTKMAKDLSDHLLWMRRRTRGRMRERLGLTLRLSPRQESFQSVLVLAALYVGYGTGALSCAFGFHRWGVSIAAAPLTLVVATIVADLVRPMSPEP